MRDERGSAPTEVVLVAPLLIILLLFVVFVGRLTSAQQDVTAAARDGARAASLRAMPADAQADAERVVAAVLAEKGIGCSELTVDVQTDRLAPGGFVVVDVSCLADLSDLAVLKVPGSKTVTASAREVVDAYGIQS